MNFSEYKKRAFEADPELYDEYKALAPEYGLIKQIIQARTEQSLTQQTKEGEKIQLQNK